MLRVWVAPTTTARLLVEGVATTTSFDPEMLLAPPNPGLLGVPVEPWVPVPAGADTVPESLPEEDVYSQPLSMASMRAGKASPRYLRCMSFPSPV